MEKFFHILLTFQRVERVPFLAEIAQGGRSMERLLTIGQLAQATGVSAKTIRYYEQVGVLPVPSRSGAGYRQYARGDVHRLLFVRRARALGLSLATLKTLMAELDSGACLTMRPRLHTLVTEQLHTVQQQIAEFQLLEQQLTQVLRRLESDASAPHTERCQCLDLDLPEGRQPLQDVSPSLSKGKTMNASTLESLTRLPSEAASEEYGTESCDCGCGCGCSCTSSLTPLSRPQEAAQRSDSAETEA
jgi:DNA-binding transcriptional MerR regulator